MLVAILLVVLLTVSGQLTGLAVALGAATAGVAFALQEVIASVAGWLAIIFGGFFRTGDRVELGKIRGDVIDVGVLRTTLMEIGEWVNGDRYTGRIVRVANSFVFKEPVFNYSGDFEFLWDEVRVAIRFGSDYEEARRIVQAAIGEVTQAYSDGARSRWHELVKKYRLEDAQDVPPLDLLERDLSYARFLLDGQTAVLDDYLEVRPDAAARLGRLVASGRVQVGPWMILMDEFMVSGETIVRDIRLRDPAYLDDAEVNDYLNALGARLTAAAPGARPRA